MMTDRMRAAPTVGYQSPNKMENDLSPRKTMVVLVIVVGCFAVLWPKVFYPMLVGSANQHIKPSPIDKTTGCCDVISETDVNTIKIMSELCGTIIQNREDKPLTGKEIVQKCRQEILDTCGIDVAIVLQEQVRLGQSVKQILDEIRSLNGSLCLKYNYGVAPWRLGVPHRVTLKTSSDSSNIRQERPLHLRSELVHPAFRERGRAIPQPQAAPPPRPPPRIVEGRPGPIPGMRPTIGGAGHVVSPKQGTSSMSVIMPIYTIGIVIFFTYTLIKIIFKKQPQQVEGSLYPPIDPDPHFRKEVFESESSRLASRITRDNISSKLVVNAMSALLDEVDQEIQARRKSSEDLANGTLSNGNAVKPHDDDQSTVTVLGMEMTASCEGGKKWSRPESPVLPPPSLPAEPVPPPQEIYLEGALPAQSQLLVSDSAIEPEPATGDDPAVVLSGKMTLSVISLDSENGVEEPNNEMLPEQMSAESTQLESLRESEEKQLPILNLQKTTSQLVEDFLNEDNKLPATEEIKLDQDINDLQKTTSQLVEDLLNEDNKLPATEEIKLDQDITDLGEPCSDFDKDIEEFLKKLKSEHEFQTPSITLESDDTPTTLEVETLEKEVDDLIKQAIENVQLRESEPILTETTNEIKEEASENELESILNIPTEFSKLNNNNSPKIDLSREITSEIEKLIQEVKDIPIIEKIDEPIQETVVVSNRVSNEVEDACMKIRDTMPSKQVEALKSTIDTAAETTKLSNVAVEEVSDTSEKHNEKISPINEFLTNVSEKIETKEEERSIVRSSSNTSKPEDEELASDEELVEEIEEIVYEEESGEEEEIEIEIDEEEEEDDEDEDEDEDESGEEIPNNRSTSRNESSSIQRVNGERSEDFIEESKYTTVSGATAAENDISDEDLTDNEEVAEEEEEIIEVEEIDEEDYVNEKDVNHVEEESESEE